MLNWQLLVFRMLSDYCYQVFQSALRWIQHKVEERRSLVFEILHNVRFPFVAKATIERAIYDCEDNSVKIALRFMWKNILQKNRNYLRLRVQPRLRAKKYIFVIGGSKRELVSTWTRSSECTSVEKFDIFKKYALRRYFVLLHRLYIDS